MCRVAAVSVAVAVATLLTEVSNAGAISWPSRGQAKAIVNVASLLNHCCTFWLPHCSSIPCKASTCKASTRLPLLPLYLCPAPFCCQISLSCRFICANLARLHVAAPSLSPSLSLSLPLFLGLRRWTHAASCCHMLLPHVVVDYCPALPLPHDAYKSQCLKLSLSL